MFSFDMTQMRLMPVHKHSAGSACLCDPYLILSSPHVVNMQCRRVLVTFSLDEFFLVVVWKSPSITMMWSGGISLL